MGTQLPPEKGHAHPTKILAHVYCGQTAGWIKMPVDTEVNLGPSDVVLDGVAAAPSKKDTAPARFLAHVYCGQTAGWIKMPIGTEVDLGPGHSVQGPSSRERGTSAPSFRPMSIVATVAHLSYC